MDCLGDFLERSDLGLQETKYNEQADGVQISEILRDEAVSKFETRKIANLDVVQWVDRHVDVPETAQQVHNSMHIVWVTRNFTFDSRSCDISKNSQDYILNRFEIKRVCQLVPDRGFICLPLRDEQPSDKHAFALSISTGFVLAWTHELTTGRTNAVCWGDDIYNPAPKIQKVLRYQKSLTKHPMFMAFIASVVISQHVQDELKYIREKVNQVESRTRHSPFGQTRTAVGSYSFLSATMSAQTTSLATIERDSTTLRQVLESLADYQWPQGIEKPDWADKIIAEGCGCVDILLKRLKAQELQTRYLTQRAQIQLNALFNLVTQQENQLSISVAQDSRTLASATKDDSTAMKTMAAVTVIFLPGTFVSAMFAMPLFQWDTQNLDHPGVSRQFWVYWAVTLPLTFVTVILWLAWMRLQRYRQHARKLEGYAALDRELATPPKFSKGSMEDFEDSEKGVKKE